MAALALALALQTLVDDLSRLDPRVPCPTTPEADVQARLRAAGERESRLWRALGTRADWEAHRDVRLRALRDSLGLPAEVPADLRVRVVRTLEAEGCRIDVLTYESRPGVVVTANLYAPATSAAPGPAILIAHSHHAPKTQGELQDMGRLWARAGCTVLVPDLPGHGERRAHPFKDAASFPGPFKPSRQDYWFRYNSAAQLHLAGESLMGWMAWDLMRGVDLLLARPGVDPARVALLGAVAGGGDPAGVTAALDARITAVVPFNFGGPQPETRHPLPEDAETSFDYVGSGGWESTRNLRLSARDGFLPWVIVGGAAPRAVVHAHEFAWDRERDPVWKRYQRIFAWTGAPDRLAFAHGRGSVRGQGEGNTHCTNIGAEHRASGIYAAFERWLAIPAPARENAQRSPAEDLLTGAAVPPLHLAAARAAAGPPAGAKAAWARILGGVEPSALKAVEAGVDARVERVRLEGDGAAVPLLLLKPGKDGRRPVVVAVADDGKAGFLKHRAAEIAALLEGGAVVCLPDVRGSGERRAGTSLGRTSAMTSLSSSELMLGRTIAGLRVSDLRAVLAWLRAREDVDPARIALWGDAFTAPNPPETRVDVPWDAAALPAVGRPGGALTALLGAWFEPSVMAVVARGGLASFASVLESPFVHLPHDAIVPGAIPAGDWAAIEAGVACPARIEARIDGRNRRVGPEPEGGLAAWLLARLAQ
jgi:dienelactone hydrolase